MRILLLILFLQSTASAGVLLKTVFKEGAEFDYTISTEQTINQIVQGNQAKQENKNSTRYTLKVQKVNEDGSAEIKCTYKAVAIFLNSGLSIVKYDSADSSQVKVPKEAKPVASLVGKSFTFKVNGENKVTAVKGMEEIIEAMIKETVSAFSPKVKEQIEANFKKIYGDTAITQVMQQMFSIYPGKEVKVGDNWKSDNNIESVFSFKVDNLWTLKKVDDNKAEVQLQSTVTPAKKEFELNGIKLKHNVSGDQEGKFIFSVNGKHLASSLVTQTLSGAMKMDRMNIPINIKSKITQTLTAK